MDKQPVFDVQFVCGDQLIDYRDSALYNTVKIGTQCWMAENLNAGNRINVSQGQTDNGTIEKYCYNDIEDSCNVYGGLYQWNEMMGYKTTAGAQGICPEGWHIPTDNVWKILEMVLGMSQASADSLGWRGTTEGGRLKETGNRYWDPPNTGATDSAGFAVLGAGFRVDASTYSYLHRRATIWSSSLLSGSPLIRRLDYNQSNIYRNTSYKIRGRSVRCVRD
ncbi:MAG: fibrobacter succinogenes major paralogous domain-containing protein [Bacteroidales bacterium]|nr:fibrobacter succinogenes major paralogous domain-containing protein [Bacteroidales bacterium]